MWRWRGRLSGWGMELTWETWQLGSGDEGEDLAAGEPRELGTMVKTQRLKSGDKVGDQAQR